MAEAPETPTTILKKRIRSAAPADGPKNINFGDDSGIILDGPIFSPTAKPDLKKKRKVMKEWEKSWATWR